MHLYLNNYNHFNKKDTVAYSLNLSTADESSSISVCDLQNRHKRWNRK